MRLFWAVVVLISFSLTSCFQSTEDEQLVIDQGVPEKGTDAFNELIIPGGTAAENIYKANTLFIVAKNHLSSSPKEAQFYAEHQLKISELVDYKRGIGDALSLLGVIARRSTDYERALEYHLKSLAVRESMDDDNGAFKSNNNVGNIYFDNHMYQDAQRYYEKALAIGQDNAHPTQIARLYRNLGKSYTQLNNFSQANNAYNKAIDLAIEHNLNDLQVNTMIDQAAALVNAGNKEEGITIYESSVNLSRRIENKFYEVQSLHNIGAAYLYMGQNDKALDYLQTAESLYGQVDDYLTSDIYQNLAIAFRKENNLQESIKLLGKSNALAIKINDSKRVSQTYQQLAEVYEQDGDLQNAFKYRKKLSEINAEIIETERTLMKTKTEKIKKAEMAFAAFNTNAMEKAMESKYFGYFVTALFVGLVIFVLSFYSSVIRLWKA